MNKKKFRTHLQNSSLSAVEFAKKYITNTMPTEFRYDVLLQGAEKKEELDGQHALVSHSIDEKDLSIEEAIELLYRDSKIPIWINICVIRVNKKYTSLQLLCSNYITSDETELYYIENGNPPFGVKSPLLAPDFEEGKKFRIKTKKPLKKIFYSLLSLFLIAFLFMHFYVPRFITETKNPILESLGRAAEAPIRYEESGLKGRSIQFRSFDGTELSAYLTYSSLDTTKGCIILLHGIRAYKEHFIGLSKELSDSWISKHSS